MHERCEGFERRVQGMQWRRRRRGGLQLDQGIQHGQHARFARAGGDAASDSPIRDCRADAVAAVRRDPAEEPGSAHGDRRFELYAAAEIHRGIEVDEQPDRTLTLLAIQLGVRSAAPCGDPPIDAARIVAGNILTHFLELESATALRAAVTAEEQSTSGSART